MADEQLTDAIRAGVARAVEDSGGTPGMVMTDYVLVAACKGWDDEGEPVTQVVVIPEGPAYAVSGLLHEATVRMDADTLDGLGGPL